MNRSAAGQISDTEIGTVLTAGKTDGGDPGGSLVDEDDEEEQVQRDGGCGVAGAACEGGDGFAYGFDVGTSLWLKRDRTCLWGLLVRRG